MNYFDKANHFYVNKNYTEAINMYKKAIEYEENKISSMYNTAVCYIKLKKFNEAKELLKDVIALRSESKYYFNLAYCYAMLGNTQKALYNFNIAWCLDENDSECEKAINILLENHL